MHRVFTSFGSVHRLFIVLAAGLLLGCEFGSDSSPNLAEGPGGTQLAVEVALPPNGAELSADTTLSVVVSSGTLDRVTFGVDGDVVETVSSPPFTWTFDPAFYPVGQHSLSVAAYSGDDVVLGDANVFVVRPDVPPPPPPPANVEETLEAIASLSAAHWLEIPNSRLDSVKPDPEPDGVLGVRGVMDSWSGGAFDTKRERLIVWGGGHTGYAGNEIYAFDVPTLTWLRLTDPSPFPSGDPNNSNDKGAHPDGSPISRHSYNYIDYIPEPVDALFVGGGSGIWRTGQFGENGTYLYEFANKRWVQKSENSFNQLISSFCAVDASGIVWQHSTQGASKLATFDATKDEWKTEYQPNQGLPYGYTATCNTDLNWLVAVGNGKTLVWELNSPASTARELQTSGATEIESGDAHGVAYHPGTKSVVVWSGGSSVYTLDCSTGKWTKVAGRNNVSPVANSNGTYGRFRYMPKRDRFIVVNNVNKNVFVYRLPTD